MTSAPGYGYSDVKDKWYDIPQPEDDGIYLVDMETGKSRMIISIAQMLKTFPNEVYPNAKFVVNHITFNTTGDRFLFLLRNFWDPTAPGWKTTLITSDLDGNMYELKHTRVEPKKSQVKFDVLLGITCFFAIFQRVDMFIDMLRD